MNIALMKQVEKAVRPVRAGWERKMAMREELLAHLTAIYEDELAQGSSEEAAQARALERFGDPASLASDLERSIGRLGRMAHVLERIALYLDHLFDLHPGESLRRYSLRIALTMLVVFGMVSLAAALLLQFHPDRTDTTRVPVALKSLLLLGFSTIVLQIGIQATRIAMAERRRLRVAAVLAACCALLIGASGAYWWSIVYNLDAWLAHLLRIAITIVASMCPFLLVCAWLSLRKPSQLAEHHRWLALDLES